MFDLAVDGRNLWATTNQGVSRYDTTRRLWTSWYWHPVAGGQGYELTETLPGRRRPGVHQVVGGPLKPRALRRGDLVAVVAPAGPVPHARLVKGVRELERHGLRVRLGAGVLSRARYLAGEDDRRAVDLVALWANPEVKAVFAARGGYGSARIVDALTPGPPAPSPQDLLRLLRQHDPPPGLRARGARLVPRADGGVGPGRRRAHGRRDARRGDAPAGRRRPLGRATDARPAPASRAAAATTPASFRAALFAEGARGLALAPPAARTIVPGKARGRLVGGCLSLIVASIGCPEELDARGAILLLEDVIEPPFRIDRMLTQLRRAGVFDGVRGVVLGDFPACHPEKDAGWTLEDVLRDRLGDLGVPVVWRFPYGHTARPSLTLPLGTRATLDAGRRPRLTLDETADRALSPRRSRRPPRPSDPSATCAGSARQRYHGGSFASGSGSSLLAHIGSWWIGAVSSDPHCGQIGSPRSLNFCSLKECPRKGAPRTRLASSPRAGGRRERSGPRRPDARYVAPIAVISVVDLTGIGKALRLLLRVDQRRRSRRRRTRRRGPA